MTYHDIACPPQKRLEASILSYSHALQGTQLAKPTTIVIIEQDNILLHIHNILYVSNNIVIPFHSCDV